MLIVGLIYQWQFLLLFDEFRLSSAVDGMSDVTFGGFCWFLVVG